ncbi:MAG: hypothetical protein Hyperionvirus23_23 [Hyperionvirus sp.]|uniref:Uncharacterized protein n=1 Tax=Hyperionvirus sp. TaxID=2487770 RepID=A0A3G5AAV4_9VIRU|nr:MAG: hypothetical protein Hyperionvirus23_23 [Hyperionvirus sp.]
MLGQELIFKYVSLGKWGRALFEMVEEYRSRCCRFVRGSTPVSSIFDIPGIFKEIKLVRVEMPLLVFCGE